MQHTSWIMKSELMIKQLTRFSIPTPGCMMQSPAASQHVNTKILIKPNYPSHEQIIERTKLWIASSRQKNVLSEIGRDGLISSPNVIHIHCAIE